MGFFAPVFFKQGQKIAFQYGGHFFWFWFRVFINEFNKLYIHNIHNLYLTWEKHLAIAILQVFHKLILRKKERKKYVHRNIKI